MQIQKINNQQNQNFKARIHAPQEFWSAVKKHVPDDVAKDALARIFYKPNSDTALIVISKDSRVKVREGVFSAPDVYTAWHGTGKLAEKSQEHTWQEFLTVIADKFAPAKSVDELISEVRM